MLSAKVEISWVSDRLTLDRCIYQSTGLFYKLYNNADLMADKSFKKGVLSDLDTIDVSMYDFLVSAVETKKAQRKTEIENKTKELEQIETILNSDSIKISNRQRYKLRNKAYQLKRNINKDCCFGGKNLLRSITKHAQLANNYKGILTESQVQENKELYKQELELFRENRTLGIYLLGRANEGGNRKVNFDLANKKIIFKPNKNNHIEIKFNDKRNELFTKLQAMADAKLIPITVRITKKHIHFMYDEALLSGFAFNASEYKRQLKAKHITSDEGKKQLAKEMYEELEKRMLVGKLKHRFASIDTNPKEIALVIGDRLSEDKKGDFTVIFKKTFNLEELCEKKGFASSSKRGKSYNNKRKHELRNVMKEIFKICLHHKVFNFVSEDLNIKINHKKENSVEFNRQVKNIWHRELTSKLITKWVNIHGFKHIPVNPAYSSFIGNMIYNDYDPVAAATELLRRGMVKYIKGSSLYPDLRLINQQKLNYLVGENNSCQSFKSLYTYVTCAGLRYRNREKPKNSTRVGKYLNSYKSKVKILCS